VTPALHITPADVFRASGDFELALLDRLPAGERELLSELGDDPEIYGLARPRDGGGSPYAVSCEAALLLLTLREPGTLPRFARRGSDGEERLAGVAELVLDGLLEVRCGDRFVSGAEALERLAPASGAERVADGALSVLTEAALRYGESLGLDDVEELAMRLYCYHRLPLTPRRWRRLPDAAAVEDFLGLGGDRTLERRLGAEWRRVEEKEEEGNRGWIRWRRRGRGRGTPAGGGSDRPTYKLYLSPRPEALSEVFATLVELLPATAATAFKVGNDALGILRPDKLVVYFASFEELSGAAEELAPRLAGLAVHGVPFTAEIAGDGLLSWGMDPPRSWQLLSWRQRESWRLWVVYRLAAALVTARRRPAAETPGWRFALERLRLEGVEVASWTPSQSLFNRPVEPQRGE